VKNNKRMRRKKRLQSKKKHHLHREQRKNGRGSGAVAQNLTDSLKYLQNDLGTVTTEKDKLQAKWIEKRAGEIRKTYGSTDSFIFMNASIAVSELERLYDTMEVAVKEHFPDVDVDDFFRTVKMYMGKSVSEDYTYLTDWKTLMFTIAGNIPEPGTFPTLGFHYDLVVSSRGLLGIQMKNGNMIAIIPVFPGAEKTDGRIYPQDSEPLKNGNLEHSWEKWYELNKLIGNEKEWFKSMKCIASVGIGHFLNFSYSL